jgi:hypothetical protein
MPQMSSSSSTVDCPSMRDKRKPER